MNTKLLREIINNGGCFTERTLAQYAIDFPNDSVCVKFARMPRARFNNAKEAIDCINSLGESDWVREVYLNYQEFDRIQYELENMESLNV